MRANPTADHQTANPGESSREETCPGQFLDTSRCDVEAGDRAEEWQEEVPQPETEEAQCQSAERDDDPDQELLHGFQAPPHCRITNIALPPKPSDALVASLARRDGGAYLVARALSSALLMASVTITQPTLEAV